ncbi:hypothetical protein BJ170DRAFT_122831 [Xylariales sp. AK1849]|nr:hypothetical protein BJ170DRAFT_122831 [Xylariales sp. AK1849]
MAAQDPNASTEYNGAALVGTSITFIILTWLCVSLRIYVRAVMLRSIQLDDWLMILSQVVFTIFCAFVLTSHHHGLGRHNASLDQSNEIEAIKYLLLTSDTYLFTMLFIKLSIAILLLRLATQKRYRYTIWGSIVVVAIWSIALFFFNVFQCHPVAAIWDYRILMSDPTAYCVSLDKIINAGYSLSVMSILSDWLYALIPIPILWNAKMTQQAKATVVVILGLGVFASVATLIRMRYLVKINYGPDILFNATDATVWSIVEPGIAIIASSLATIRPLLRAWKIRGFQSRESSDRIGPRVSCTNKAIGSRELDLVDVEAGSSTLAGSSDCGTSAKQSKRSTRFSQTSWIDGETIDVDAVEPSESPRLSRQAMSRSTRHSPSSSAAELTRTESVHSQTDG